MSYQNIPAELQAIPNWVLWQYEDIGASKPTKVPYNPHTGEHANVNDSSTWSDFATVIRVQREQNLSGIGFVFNNCGYTFIDLDDTNGDQIATERQIKIFREFDSYAEVSPSNKGLHIIVRGSVPAGRRRSNIEIYSNQRYATFTGNIYNSVPIADRQELLTQLWEQMGGGITNYAYNGNEIEKEPDTKIIDQALNAINGDKFKTLLDGAWENLYPSQSEADLAFINIIAFYTQNQAQITRIYRNSKLGNSNKKRQRIDYIDGMIKKSFDQMLPPIDFDGFKNAVELKLAQQQLKLPLGPVAQQVEPVPHKNLVASSSLARTTKKLPLTVPPGLIGEIAQFLYNASPRPVAEIALAGAIALMAGICGRAYNISRSGLNQYILLLADSGTGKESMASGINLLMNAVRLQVPTADKFIGPGSIASGQALVKYLNNNSQCFLSILGEFGLKVQQMSGEHASSAQSVLKDILLDVYNKSGYHQMFKPAIFADKDKNISVTPSPSFSILGETNPEVFYNSLTEEMIYGGLLPRFMIIEYSGPVPPLNKSAENIFPSFQLIEKLSSLVAQCEMIMNANPRRVINIKADYKAEIIFDEFEEFTRNQTNKSNRDIFKRLWSRAHMKALKLAGIVAVGINNIEPEITEEHCNWAIEMVQSDIETLTDKFESGIIGTNTNETKQVDAFKRMLREYLTKDWTEICKYCTREDLYYARIVPLAYFNRRLSALACYRLDKNGATFALKRVIQALVNQDIIREVGKKDLAEKYGTTQQAFMLSHFGLLD